GIELIGEGKDREEQHHHHHHAAEQPVAQLQQVGDERAVLVDGVSGGHQRAAGSSLRSLSGAVGLAALVSDWASTASATDLTCSDMILLPSSSDCRSSRCTACS